MRHTGAAADDWFVAARVGAYTPVDSLAERYGSSMTRKALSEPGDRLHSFAR